MHQSRVVLRYNNNNQIRMEYNNLEKKKRKVKHEVGQHQI